MEGLFGLLLFNGLRIRSTIQPDGRSSSGDSPSPRAGDIVITRTSRSGLAYEVQVVPGPPQIRFGTRKDAFAQARLLAKRGAVDAWFRDGDTVTLLARFRLDR
ncbi:MAG: hypothetical protein HYY76_05790 [Acidobacteria bacterium]|nr:hypothetical protein [Acidobacteriota bacterium]